VKFAYDGNPSTRWRTVQYFGNPKLGNIKRGVGLVLDLDTPATGARVASDAKRHWYDRAVPRPKVRPVSDQQAADGL
jgi:putative peptidoglycan lipid II flippase